ncbi:hypothetical protein F5Y16DRAFT_190132 [Xylariaceae sp. FL0255]|nr:hypothetical protein F5Y16DRAFT_190132 [Xylariaceae sp. FL0255]
MTPPITSPHNSTREFQILESLVQEQPESDSTVSTVLRQIVNLTSTALASNDGQALRDHAYHVCVAVITLASLTPPHRQSKLVELLVELQKQVLGDRSCTNRKPFKYDGEESLGIWEDMPTLGYTVRDAWNFNPNDPKAKPEEKAGWENKTAFIAQVMSRVPIDHSEGAKNVFDFSVYALWAMREAFEGYEQQPSDTALRAACLWFIYTGEALLAKVEQGAILRDRVGFSHERFSQKGWRGFERERVDVWKNGLVAASERLRDGDTKGLVEQALMKIGGPEAK